MRFGAGTRARAHTVRSYLRLAGALSVAAALLSGCAALGIGESEYGCPGRPSGVTCMSAREVYKETDNRVSLSNDMLAENADRSGKDPSAKEGARKDGGERRPAAAPQDSASVAGMPVPAVLPDGSVPVRSPSHVMRIWVAAFETPTGDLVMPGYVYTEIVPRRWQVGLPTPDTQRVLAPLSVRRASTN
ncbi:type IV conjugative transfer system lipoprotein TraV [Azospirillum sp. sgz302134]